MQKLLCVLKQTSTGHGPGGLALNQVRVCGRGSSVLLQAAVELHVEPILVFLLHGTTLSVLCPVRGTLAAQKHFLLTISCIVRSEKATLTST